MLKNLPPLISACDLANLKVFDPVISTTYSCPSLIPVPPVPPLDKVAVAVAYEPPPPHILTTGN